jgi:hypothetical protein
MLWHRGNSRSHVQPTSQHNKRKHISPSGQFNEHMASINAMNLEKAYPKQNSSSSLTYRPMFTSVCSTKIDQAREITSKPLGARPTSPCYATACEPVLSSPKGTDPNMEELVVEGGIYQPRVR